MRQKNDVIGVIPAAGHARRLGPLPCSKEVLPLTGQRAWPSANGTVPLACDHALDALRLAGVEKAFVLLREGKWDIPATLGDGSNYGIQLGYRMVGETPGVPHTLDRAYPFVKDHRVVLVFPDILFEPRTALQDVFARQRRTGADIVLGTFPAPDDQSADFVEVQEGEVKSIQVKPAETTLQQVWVVAHWTPTFTRFMHELLTERGTPPDTPKNRKLDELHLGNVFQTALSQGVQIEAVPVQEGRFLDIGTPEKLCRATQGRW